MKKEMPKIDINDINKVRAQALKWAKMASLKILIRFLKTSKRNGLILSQPKKLMEPIRQHHQQTLAVVNDKGGNYED